MNKNKIQIEVYFRSASAPVVSNSVDYQEGQIERGTVSIYHGESVLWNRNNERVDLFNPQSVVQIGGGLLFPFDDIDCRSALQNLADRLDRGSVKLIT